MPRRRRVAKQRLDRLSDRQRNILLDGFDFGPAFGAGFANEDETRAAWEIHGDALLAECAAERPGHRPVAWWRFERGVEPPRLSDEPAELQRLGQLTPGIR